MQNIDKQTSNNMYVNNLITEITEKNYRKWEIAKANLGGL
jgi:hypothetical protein